jgi:hypothetical protein
LHRPASPREIVEARWLFALLAVQFIVPAVSYLVTPEVAIDTLDQLNRLLGGGPYVVTESRGHVWHMLAVGNVMTLGFMCAALAIDFERNAAMLPALAFLKGFSALSSRSGWVTGRRSSLRSSRSTARPRWRCWSSGSARGARCGARRIRGGSRWCCSTSSGFVRCSRSRGSRASSHER